MPDSASSDFLHGSSPMRDGEPETQLEPKWFAVYTMPRHEKRVQQYLNERDVEHYLPLYRSQRMWSDGSRVTLDLPLFPGYLFVNIKRNERVRVLGVPGVLTIVGGVGREPASLPDAEIKALRSGLHLRHAEPHCLMTIGQRARIRSGAFAGMTGVVIRMKGSLRVVLTLDLIMRSIAVEVDARELDLLDPKSPALPGAELHSPAVARLEQARFS
jgi:transcription antitermination factor NusG